ncbi:MAG: FAD-dependent oxidoreductase [Aquificaceae bacterium]
MKFDYHVVILGGGLAYVGAEVLKNRGLKVALIEKNREHLGGVCLHEGCIPTKLYMFEAQKIYDIRLSRLASLNVQKVNLKTLLEYKRGLIKKLREDIERLLKGVDIFYGEGKLIEPHVVEVNGKKISGESVIINVGKRHPSETDGEYTLNTDQLLELEEIPEEISILGDDPIGFEFATMLSTLGTRTEVYFDEPFSFMHPSIKTRLMEKMDTIGIKLFSTHRLKSKKEGKMLVVKKRIPNWESVGDLIPRGEENHLIVDRNYETALKDHYAVGDINGISETAHAARLQAISVSKKITEGRGFYIKPEKIPYILYTIPLSYAKVGFSKADLEKKGIKYTEKSVNFRAFAISHIQHSEEGICFLYFDQKGFLLGAEVLSRNAADIISSLTVSLHAELDISIMSKIPLAHPTMSEVPFIRLMT